jgi:hypothetical protein
MNREVLHLQVNNVICEGYGCFNKANTKINVKVGQLGTILLDLCTDCVKKFDDGNTPGKSNLKQKLISGEDRRVTSTQDR